MIKHSTDGLLFSDGGRELHIVAYDVSPTNALVHADGLGLLPIHFYITFDDSQLENADCSGGMGTILVSLSKDGLISAGVSRLAKQAVVLAMAVIAGTDSCSVLVACARPAAVVVMVLRVEGGGEIINQPKTVRPPD